MNDLNEYRKHVEAAIAEIKRDLARFESGEMRTGSRTSSEPEWRDTSQETIERHKENLSTFEMILADLDERLKGKR